MSKLEGLNVKGCKILVSFFTVLWSLKKVPKINVFLNFPSATLLKGSAEQRQNFKKCWFSFFAILEHCAPSPKTIFYQGLLCSGFYNSKLHLVYKNYLSRKSMECTKLQIFKKKYGKFGPVSEIEIVLKVGTTNSLPKNMNFESSELILFLLLGWILEVFSWNIYIFVYK